MAVILIKGVFSPVGEPAAQSNVAICIIGAVLARTGISALLVIVTPIFLTIYPPFIMFTLLGLFDKHVPNDGVYKGAVFTALFFGFLDGVVAMCPGFTALPALLSHIPLYSMGFGWVIPTIIMSVAGGIIYRNKPRRYYDIESGNVFVKEQA